MATIVAEISSSTTQFCNSSNPPSNYLRIMVTHQSVQSPPDVATLLRLLMELRTLLLSHL